MTLLAQFTEQKCKAKKTESFGSNSSIKRQREGIEGRGREQIERERERENVEEEEEALARQKIAAITFIQTVNRRKQNVPIHKAHESLI